MVDSGCSSNDLRWCGQTLCSCKLDRCSAWPDKHASILRQGKVPLCDTRNHKTQPLATWQHAKTHATHWQHGTPCRHHGVVTMQQLIISVGCCGCHEQHAIHWRRRNMPG